MTDKQPATLDSVLKNLYAIQDAIKHENFIEAIRYCADAQVAAKNESAWTYQTDPNLPYILDFLEELTKSISLALQSTSTCRANLQSTIIEELNIVLQQIPKIVSAHGRHDEPDTHLDELEVAHRQRIYHNTPSDK